MKNEFKIPIINKWYIALTLIFILAQYVGIINWSPIWIFAPLWIPISLCLVICGIIYLLKLIIYIYENYNRH